MAVLPSLDAARARRLAQAIGAGRIALGVTALVAPRLPLRPWVGAGAGRHARMLARALGARDVALGAGVVMALRHGAPVRGWVEAGGIADAGDVAITAAYFPSLPGWGRLAVLAAAAGGVVAARLAAPGVDGSPAVAG